MVAGSNGYASLPAVLQKHHQDHLLRGWSDLAPEQQSEFGRQLAGVHFDLIQELYQASQQPPSRPNLGAIRQAPVLELPQAFEEWELRERAATRGEAALSAGQVAVVLVAGGQGTRLGFDGPKGTYSIGPVSGKSLFQIHVEKVLALNRRYETSVPLYIMTSPENDDATRAFFEERRFFGLEPAQVRFFPQGTMPAVEKDTGRLLLTAPGQLALSPNGHGGTLQALADQGHLTDLERRGIKYLFYFQVDNPLVKVADPAYLGEHIDAGAEMSLKVVRKAGPEEKVGVFVEVDGKPQVLEYTELPKELAERRGADGRLEIWAGSIAIHLFNVDFLARLASTGRMLPYHRAIKKVPYMGDHGEVVKPEAANAIKFEMFIFDAIPLARGVLAVETDRREEFEPLKNAEGDNSPATVKQAMSDLYGGWLMQAGVEVPRRADGSVAVPIEISPLFALDPEELRGNLKNTEPITGPLLLEGAVGKD
jgi:UDP-N-acetylglucosamine/UDP-N-acetylgalactosamine diphosphorylase